MTGKGIIKKANLSLVSILLACNLSCSKTCFKTPPAKPELEILVRKKSIKKARNMRKLVAQDYAKNFVGGVYLSVLMHEGMHKSLLDYYGYGIDEFILPFFPNEYSNSILGGIQPSTERHDPKKYSRVLMAGPIGDVALAETIGYNLRRGNIPRRYQSFFATASLLSRTELLCNAFQGMSEPSMLGNDFAYFSYLTKTDPQRWFNLVALYTAISIPKMIDEAKVAAGIKSFERAETKKGALITYPSKHGLSFSWINQF